MDTFLNSNVFTGIATILTALVAILLYYWEQRKKKRDAAKIIVQEIRRAEDLINEYKEHGAYKFTKKIIATNSWAKNIHYFVGDLAQDELDKISNLYSTGEYLDSIIAKVSDTNFQNNVNLHNKNVQQAITELQTNIQNEQSTSVNFQPENKVSESKQVKKLIPIKIDIPAPWKGLLDEISYNYEPIYHSNICEKLKNIAQIK
jgi:hypothetical protein